jgi:hypothetical protein
MTDAPETPAAALENSVVLPTPGEIITSLATGNSYTMGSSIGEGFFGLVYGRFDGWGNGPCRQGAEAYEDL